MPVDDTTSVDQGRIGYWPRISWASWIIVIVMVAIWSLIAVPGVTIEGGGTSGASFNTRAHGWPAIHCVSNYGWIDGFMIGTPQQKQLEAFVENWRSDFANRKYGFQWAPDFIGPPYSGRFWTDWKNWRYFGDDVSLHLVWTGMAINLLFLTGLLGVLVALTEYRLRTRGNKFRFRLWEGLAAITFIAIVLALVVPSANASAREHRIAREFKTLLGNEADSPGSDGLRWDNVMPPILKRLMDNRLAFVLPWTGQHITFDRIVEVELWEIPEETALSESARKQLLECIKNFDQAETLNAQIYPGNAWILESGAFQEIKKLQVGLFLLETKDRTDFDWNWLNEFKSLEVLEIDDRDFEDRVDPRIQAETILNQVANPEKLIFLRIGTGFRIDESTNLRRFTGLNFLELSDVEPGTLEMLIQNNPGIERLLDKN